MTRAEYRAWLDNELLESKRGLESRLGKPVTAVAYPYGGYDERVVERTQKAGYRIALGPAGMGSLVGLGRAAYFDANPAVSLHRIYFAAIID